MVRNGPGLEKRQGLLFRAVDVGADLFAMAAAVKRADVLARRRETNAAQAAALADLFCRRARRRIASRLGAIASNDDRATYAAAQRLLDGDYAWLEDSVSGPLPGPPPPPAIAPDSRSQRRPPVWQNGARQQEAPMPMSRLAPRALALLLLAGGTLAATDLKPLSLADKQKLEALLRRFDPATYDIRIQYLDAKGKVQSARFGHAVGLGSVRQGPTSTGPEAHGWTIDLSPPISKRLGTAQTVNGFRDDAYPIIEGQPLVAHNDQFKGGIRELNVLLRAYTH